MPAENLVVATGGKYSSELVVFPWAGYYFSIIVTIGLAILLSWLIADLLRTKATHIFPHQLRTVTLEALGETK
jgi:hypothetical protein